MRQFIRPLTNSTRVRTLEDWLIDFWVSTENERVYFLRGRVVADTSPDYDPNLVRLTSTSPIQHVEGNVVTTVSGSTYTLGTCGVAGVSTVPSEYHNTHIDFSDWPNWPQEKRVA